ncbi:hypothetical protein DY000_02026866 [Brassica cretica]|uniref:UDP-glucuronate decarboxylase n=1 Tax=Brassica cretica TaxID=69181 RepID=A0ABQ7EJY3_BRACR|nr:hypothetical protein DY000_02026866 [Brassica cretica]
MGTLNMLGLAKRVGARFLLTSTSEVYGDPLEHPQKETYWGNVNPIGERSCYDEGKRTAETLAMDYHRGAGVEVRIARIFNTYGPRMCLDDGRVVSNFVAQAIRKNPMTVYGDGKQTRSFQYVSDLVSKQHLFPAILLHVRTGEAVRIVNQHANRRFYICCNKEVELLPLRELPSPLKELLDAPMFRVLICVANGMIAFTSSGAHVDHIITGKPGQSFTEYMVKTNTVSVHSCVTLALLTAGLLPRHCPSLLLFSLRFPLSDVAMSAKKKKLHPPFAVSMKIAKFARSSGCSSLAKKNNGKSLSSSTGSVCGGRVSGPFMPVVGPKPVSGPAEAPLRFSGAQALLSLSFLSLPSTAAGVVKDPVLVSVSSPASGPPVEAVAPVRNYASLFKSTSGDLQEMEIPSEHSSGVQFVLIPEDNIQAAKKEFKDFIYAKFHSDVSQMGRIIGVLNAISAKSGPRIYVHSLGKGAFLLKVINAKTREALLARSCWNITGVPMFVSPWSPDFTPEETPLTSVVVQVEMRNVPYLLFHDESLSRLATAVGRPVALAPETRRKPNFQVAKVFVKVDLIKRLPDTIVSGFSNGREVIIDVTYPWLSIKCLNCGKYGHKKEDCKVGVPTGSLKQPAASKSDIGPHPERSESGEDRQNSVPQVDEAPPSVSPTAVLAEPVSSSGDSGADNVSSESLTPNLVDDIEPGEIVEEVPPPTEIVEEVPPSPEFVAAIIVHESTGTVGSSGVLMADFQIDNAGTLHGSEGSVQPVACSADEGNNVEPVATQVTEPSIPPAGTSLDPDMKQPTADDEAEQVENPYLLVRNRRSGRKATTQSVTCGVHVPSENLNFTVSFVYGFNFLEDRTSLWTGLEDLQTTTPVSRCPWVVLGDFNQILRTEHHSNHLSARVDTAGIEDINLSLQETKLFEAQAKGLTYTWKNNQDENLISTKIDHAFINHQWASTFPDFIAEFLELSQSDHTPCLFRLPSHTRQVRKPFKFFHHVIDQPQYSELVNEGWQFDQIVGTNQFKLVRSLKLLKVVLRGINTRHYSGISRRVKEQSAIVDNLQRSLLTAPDQITAREEHVQRDHLNTLLNAEQKFYRQRSRVRWADV